MAQSSVESPRQEGEIDVAPLFDLELGDKEIVASLRTPIQQAISYWNQKDGYNLDERRQRNKKLYLGKQQDKSRLYEHNVLYSDNRIFISVETLVSQVTAQVPQPDVYPATNKDSSLQLAEDIGKVCVAYVEQYDIMRTFKIAMRHLFLYRQGCLKLRFDPKIGKDGEIVTEYVNPEDLIWDKDARPNQNPRFVAQWLEASVEELIAEYPDQEVAILKKAGIVRQTQRQMSSKWGYLEVWFTYIKPDNSYGEACCWLMDDVVLGKMRNPNWNYSEDSEYAQNYLDYPLKPYIPLSYLNLGEHIIDDTTMIEQAEQLQEVLNRRGRQIVENADNTNAGWVFNSNMIDVESVKNLTGAFDERIMVDGPPNQAAMRLPASALPSYVMDDKLDARTEIDDIFGTHNLTHGQGFVNRTLGQAVLQQRQDLSRQDDLIRAFEAMTTKYYQYLLQMIKVYYTEDHLFRVVGENGSFDFIAMNQDKIEDGVDIRVRPGTTLAMDKQTKRDTAVQLAGMRMIDPTTLYEDLGLPNAKMRAERLAAFMRDPQGAEQQAEKEEMDRDAFMDIALISAGQKPVDRDDYEPEYVNYYKKFLMSGAFRALPQKVQDAHAAQMQKVIEYLKQQLEIAQSQLPSPEEVEAGTMQAIQQQQQVQQAAQGAPLPGGSQPVPTPQAGGAPGLLEGIPGVPGTPFRQA